jgi:2-iminoacetate synthase
MSNRIKRKTLDADEIERECNAIREMGFEHLLLVTGEHQAKSLSQKELSYNALR